MKISIVIPTCKFDVLKPCIESILKNTDLEKADAEIVVVINENEPESRKYVESLESNRFRFIWVDRRIGDITASNLGVRISNGEYIIKMDDDVRILDWGGNNYWIDLLMEPFLKEEKVGQTGTTRQYTWGGYYSLIGFLTMTTRKIWDEVGGYDEALTPGNCEDIDFSIKVQRAGYKVLQNPAFNDCNDDDPVCAYPVYHLSFEEYSKNPGVNKIELYKRNMRLMQKKYGNPTHPMALKRLKYWLDLIDEKKEVN